MVRAIKAELPATTQVFLHTHRSVAEPKINWLIFASPLRGCIFFLFFFFSAHVTAAVFIYERTCASHEGLWRLTHRRATEWACEHLFEMTVIICFWKVGRTTTKRPKTTTERCKATTKRHKMTKKKYRTVAWVSHIKGLLSRPSSC